MRTIFIHILFIFIRSAHSFVCDASQQVNKNRTSEPTIKLFFSFYGGLDSSSVSFGDRLINCVYLIEKMPPLMTTALNKAIDCCDSGVDGVIAGLAFLYQDVLVAVPATTLLRT